jgi:hypothetical protein
MGPAALQPAKLGDISSLDTTFLAPSKGMRRRIHVKPDPIGTGRCSEHIATTAPHDTERGRADETMPFIGHRHEKSLDNALDAATGTIQ